MLLNYLKLAIRLLIRNPFFTFINILGLSVGFAVFFMLWQYSQTELSSDHYQKDSDRIARIGIDWKWTDDGKNAGHMLIGMNSSRMIRQIDQDFAEVESSLTILHQPLFRKDLTGHGSQIILSYESSNGTSIRFKENRGVYADPNLFEFFSIPLLYGEKGKVLQEKNSIVLSDKTARKFFGDKSPVGELLVLNGEESLKVTGVFQNLPRHTHLVFDFVISNRSKENEWNTTLWSFTNCYFKLTNSDFKTLENKINEKIAIYGAEVVRTLPHVKIQMILQPLREVAFNGEFVGNNFRAKSKTMLIVLGCVSVAILLMAWANYVNLTVSRTSKRMKEVATRKISGAITGDLVRQFVIEAFSINLLAVVLAATLIQFMRQPAAVFLEIHVPEIISVSKGTLIFFISVITFGILITGLYPAMLSVAYSPRSLFLMNSKPPGKRMLPSVLTTTQYASAIVLIFCGLIIHQQLNYVLSRDLGYDKEHVLIIEAPAIRGENYLKDLAFFRNEITAQPYARNVTFSSRFINLSIKAHGEAIYINTDAYGVNENYLPLYDIPLLAGRNFQSDDREDVVILTRFAAERLNFKNPHDAIGSKIIAGPQDTDWREMEIIGVTENIKTTPYYSSPNNSEAETGRGVSFVYGNKAFNEFVPETIAVKLTRENLTSSVADLEKRFMQIFAGNVFSSSFLDSQINNAYSSEKLTRNQLTFFTCLAIGIACLGLLGIITNKVVEKQREIGIRKAMGAGITSIGNVLLLTTLRQILVAIITGIPVAFYLSHQYLQRFTHQISISWWHFVAPIALLMFIMLATISYVLARAIRTNPVDSLRYE